MRFEFDQASIKHCALHRDLTAERRWPPLCLCSSRVVFPPKTTISGDGSDSEITGNTFTTTHMGLIAAFQKSCNVLNYRLTFLGQLRLDEDSTMWSDGQPDKPSDSCVGGLIHLQIPQRHLGCPLLPNLTPSLWATSDQTRWLSKLSFLICNTKNHSETRNIKKPRTE